MKNVKKLLVVLPLVLVFVISSLPVFADWVPNGDPAKLKITLKSGNLTELIELSASDLQEDKIGTGYGRVDPKKFLPMIPAASKGFREGYEIDFSDQATKDAINKMMQEIENFPQSKGFTAATIKMKEKAAEQPSPQVPAPQHPAKYTILAFDIINNVVVLTEIHDIENKSNVKSIKDMAEEFYRYESMRSGTLKEYYMVGFEPVAGDGFANYAFVKAKYNPDIICLVAPKLVPLQVIHVFPDRSNLYETILVDYYALYGDDCQINSWNAAEIAKTRIQKVNEMGYVFDRAEFQKAKLVESYILEARDAWGQRLPAGILQDNPNLLLIYYKNAPAPVAAPATDPNKRVDAVSAQKTDANVTANLQPNANVQAPVTADAQLPATGAADNAFLFLSSAALMALGTFFFKKH